MVGDGIHVVVETDYYLDFEHRPNLCTKLFECFIVNYTYSYSDNGHSYLHSRRIAINNFDIRFPTKIAVSNRLLVAIYLVFDNKDRIECWT